MGQFAGRVCSERAGVKEEEEEKKEIEMTVKVSNLQEKFLFLDSVGKWSMDSVSGFQGSQQPTLSFLA